MDRDTFAETEDDAVRTFAFTCICFYSFAPSSLSSFRFVNDEINWFQFFVNLLWSTFFYKSVVFTLKENDFQSVSKQFNSILFSLDSVILFNRQSVLYTLRHQVRQVVINLVVLLIT